MTYNERKAQLNKTMAAFLSKREGTFIDFPKGTFVEAIYCGELETEELIDVYSTEDSPNLVCVHTIMPDGNESYTDFSHFSNEEMEQIMQKCGIEIPQMEEERLITDMFGNELHIGDNVCFTLNMRKDNKPIVRATITNISYGKKADCYGTFCDWLIVDYTENHTTTWARMEDKLIQKVTPSRVVKCY